jgi:2-iminobutanoate/2-iminopropanoate deaminase
MTKQIISTDSAPRSPLYSQGIRVGSTIHVSGMAGIDAATNQLAGTTIQEQTRQALANCRAVVEAGGGSFEDVAHVTVLLANPADFAAMNEEYAKVFTSQPPTRAVTKLGADLPNLLVSIMLTAYVDD